MNPKAFLDLAQQLSRNEACEASLRTCVSRCYYALFNLMAQFVEENVGGLSRTAEDHKKVYHYFYNCNIDEIETIATDLNDLRDERNDSDYKLHVNRFCNQYEVSMLFMKASIAFNKFEEIVKSNKRRKQLIKRIHQYKKATNS